MIDPTAVPVLSPATPKADDAMRTIGEVSAELGVKPHILRYWEAQFDGLKPLKRAGGRRYYRAQDVATLRTIDRLLNREGYTVRGARQFLAGQTSGKRDAPPAAISADTAVEAPALAADIATLRAIRDRLASALDAA